MKSPLLTSVIALSLFTTSLHSRDTTADAEKLPTNIETVVSGGYWERADQDGTYRAIILLEGWEHLSNRVLIQWIRRDGDKQELVVEKTIPIKEIPGEAAWRITSAQIVKAPTKAKADSKVLVDSQFKLVLQAESEQGGKATFSVVLLADHKYLISRDSK